MEYAIQVRNKETGEWETVSEGKAVSRRKYMTICGQRRKVRNEFGQSFYTSIQGVLAPLFAEKRQWRCVAIAT